MSDVLVVGSGGREHAISWKLSHSKMAGTVYTAPGNGGTAHNVPIRPDDIAGLADFAQKHGCFTVVGPEAPLAAGIVDAFAERGLEIFGPTQAAARLESSKIFAKEFMRRHSIRTAPFEVFDDQKEASEYLDTVNHPVVIKADGLASGKGVIVCDDRAGAASAVKQMLVDDRFGDAGRRIIIEERIDGVEASYIALCDGKTAVPMATSQDHKRAHDGDSGPNTGGMGAYSPTPVIDDGLAAQIQSDVIERTVSAMKGEGTPFAGFLYAGIMIRDGQPYVLEYNVRMGDPECQPIMMRMDSDLYEYLLAASRGRLDSLGPPSWRPESAVCVVLASKGYPGKYSTGQEISGLDGTDAMIFHAGTKRENGSILTNGGRVLGVTALGQTLESAVSGAYAAADRVQWPDKFCRRDIGAKALRAP